LNRWSAFYNWRRYPRGTRGSHPRIDEKNKLPSGRRERRPASASASLHTGNFQTTAEATGGRTALRRPTPCVAEQLRRASGGRICLRSDRASVSGLLQEHRSSS